MRSYELAMVLKTSLSESARKKLLDSVKELLKAAKITKTEEWGQKPLAYPIRHEVSGYYALWQLETDEPKIGAGKRAIPAEFESRMVNNENILRHLLIRRK